MNAKNNLIFSAFALLLLLTLSACSIKKPMQSEPSEDQTVKFEGLRSGGGSSGMEQISDHSYLMVYDLKNFKPGVRLGIVSITEESMQVRPVIIDSWDDEGISSDLESICAVPGKDNEFLIAESGNWQGKLGRIFHIKVDTAQGKALVLGSAKLPKLYRNDFTLKGDQYEAMLCLPFEENKKIIVLGERGGSKKNPNGVIRWGVLDFDNYTFYISKKGLKGKEVNAPGNWDNAEKNRDITDFHMDEEGGVWASASEDQGDAGPFYSVVYKLGQVNNNDKENPITVFNKIDISKRINGFKIEALSGPCKGINSSHSFGTEDEMYGGVWRPINMDME